METVTAENKFWIVWQPRGNRSPRKRHASLEEARTESERLATLHPGRHFYIFELVDVRRIGPETLTPKQQAAADQAAANA